MTKPPPQCDPAPEFDRIAGRYDRVNRWLSLGLDRAWRQAAVRAAGPQPGEAVLDLCTGTGDLALALWRACDRCGVVGVDLSAPMLRLAERKALGTGIRFRPGDAQDLACEDASYDLVTIGFGLRNVLDRPRALDEARRVLRKEGRLVVLEFIPPRPGPLRWAVRWWLNQVVPTLGGRLGGDAGSYSYLRQSILEFPAPEDLARQMAAAGFRNVSWQPLRPGVTAIHVARR